MSLRTPLGRARGLGSAKQGVHHWWAQRVTAVALVPLTLWFILALVGLAGSEATAASAFVAHPVNAILLLLLIAATFHHLHLGLQVVIEDYVHGELAKIAAVLAIKLLAVALGVAAAFSVLKIAFGG